MSAHSGTNFFKRYAVYYTAQGAFAQAGAQWLGWDIERAQSITGADLAVIKRPQKYGFHATLKAPFRLHADFHPCDLRASFERLCTRFSPCEIPALHLTEIGGFLALTPTETPPALNALAAAVVQELDPFRAPLSSEELARRQKHKLTPRQESNLHSWGYPHVLDDFRFHMTLTGHLKNHDRAQILDRACKVFAPLLPSPFVVEALSLVAERSDGKFVLLSRAPLNG